MSKLLTGRNVLITGAGGDGVGGGVCEVAHREGARLFINDLDADRARAAAARYPGATGVPGDVSKASEIDRMFKQIAGMGVILDGLVNNAGVGLARRSHRTEEADFDRLYGVDVRGMFMVTRAFLRQLLPAKRPGSIVNISSVHARMTIAQYTLYAGAKAAVEGLTRGWAVELGADRIRCNAVAPGYVHAEQNLALIKNWAPDPRAWVDEQIRDQQAVPLEITPADCGNAVVFLLSDSSRCITGQSLCVDCGTTILLYPKNFVPLKD